MTIGEILELKENFEVELKKATGKDGKGELPNDFTFKFGHKQSRSGHK